MLIKETVNYLTKKYDTNCPFKIAKAKGIHIEYEHLGNTLGYFSKHFRIPIIHINENANERLRKYICAHELGHALLHTEINTSFLKKHTLFSNERIEIEANTFAVELLLPDDLFLDQIDSFFTIHDAFKANGIPIELMTLKSVDGNLFTLK